jgi:DNA-binding transcriptional LysR family regulator
MEVVKEMNFTRAAEKLFVTQQCLSRHIKQMEEHFGVTLFERKPALRLTPAGEQMLQAAYEFTAMEERLQTEFSNLRTNTKGKLRLGIPHSRTFAFLPYILQPFKEKFPNVEFDLSVMESAALERLVINGKIDVMIGSSTEQDPEDNKLFQTRMLLEETLNFMVADSLLQHYYPYQFPAIKEKFKKGIAFADCSRLPVMFKPKASKIHTELLKSYAALSVEPNIVIESNDCFPMIPLCKQGVTGFLYPRCSCIHCSMPFLISMNRSTSFPFLNMSAGTR